jgi:hypothetical protein
MEVISFHKNESNDIGLYRLMHLTKAKVQGKLGFGPEVMDDPSRMRYRWQFLYEVEGVQHHCGIWDYHGTKQEELLRLKKDFWFYGPLFVALELFGKERVDISREI